MIDQDRTQDLKLEGRQFYAGGLWVAFRSPLGPGQSPIGGLRGRSPRKLPNSRDFVVETCIHQVKTFVQFLEVCSYKFKTCSNPIKTLCLAEI